MHYLSKNETLETIIKKSVETLFQTINLCSKSQIKNTLMYTKKLNNTETGRREYSPRARLGGLNLKLSEVYNKMVCL